jgi:hypothetical protein
LGCEITLDEILFLFFHFVDDDNSASHINELGVVHKEEAVGHVTIYSEVVPTERVEVTKEVRTYLGSTLHPMFMVALSISQFKFKFKQLPRICSPDKAFIFNFIL